LTCSCTGRLDHAFAAAAFVALLAVAHVWSARFRDEGYEDPTADATRTLVGGAAALIAVTAWVLAR
jgi:hypothetical protein